MSRSNTLPARRKPPPAPRRAFIVEPIGNLWGSEQSLLRLATGLSAEGWEAAIYYPAGAPIGPDARATGALTLPYFETGLHTRSRMARIAAVLRMLRSAAAYRPDVLHVNQAGGVPYALILAKLLRRPVTTYVRVADDVEYLARLRPPARYLRRVLCVSDYIAALFEPAVREGIFSSSQIVRIYDPSDALPDKPAREQAAIHLCFVARFEPNKRLDVALQALALLRDRGVPATMSVLGTDRPGCTYGPEMRELARRLGLAEHVEWAGFVDDVSAFMDRASFVLCPFEREAAGIVLLEAWGSQTIPVVWSGSGGPAELVRASGGGLVYEIQDPEALADAVVAGLALAPDARAEIVERGRTWLRSHCSVSEHARQVTGVWSDAAQATG